MITEASNAPLIEALSKCTVPVGLRSLQQSMLKVAASLHEIGQEIAFSYVQTLKEAGFEPGLTSVILFGGRLRDQPLKSDSDLDLYIEVANYDNGLQGLDLNSRFSNCLDDAPLVRCALARAFINRVQDICVKHGVENHFELRHLGAQTGRLPERFQPCLVIGVANEVQQFTQPDFHAS